MNCFKVLSVGMLAAILFTGCSKEGTPENSITDSAASPGSGSPSVPQSRSGVDVGIGDAEAQFWWALTLHQKSHRPTIVNEEFETKRETIAKVDLTLNEPYPETMFIQSSSRHLRSFAGHAIRVDLDILLNDEVILNYSYITGALSQEEWHLNEIDIMQHIENIEEPNLVRGEARITMFKNVDESTITLDTPLEGSNVYSARKMSNIVRIKFN